MLYFSKGSFGFEELYNMPTSYRKFFFNKLKIQIDKENKEIEKASKHERIPGMH